jgi:hypothetical protein
MKKTEAIKNFLSLVTCPIATKYTPEMEVQVSVSQSGGERCQGSYEGRVWRGWSDGIETWKDFRIPFNGETNPEYTDSNITFDFHKHVEGVGLTGWNWQRRVSHWVGFDIDSIINHKSGLSEELLNEVTIKLRNLPYITLLKSTSGKGLHAYVFFDVPPTTNNRFEHMALARSVLNYMSADVGFNFNSTVDCCGMVLWVYHKKGEGTDGLVLLKQGENFLASKIPPNWKDHVAVCSLNKKRTHSGNHSLETMTSNLKFSSIDEAHNKIIKWMLDNAERTCYWESDYNMLVCHTYDLKLCHAKLSLVGLYDTLSEGTDTNQNCFAFPVAHGGFIVRRYGKGVGEHPLWVTDPDGNTKIYFNLPPSFDMAVSRTGGTETSKGEMIFSCPQDGCAALRDLGITLNLPDWTKGRRFGILRKKDKLLLKLARHNTDVGLPGWVSEKDSWERVEYFQEPFKEISAPDELTRHVICDGGEAGWYLLTRQEWVLQNKSNVLSALTSQMPSIKKVELEQMLGKSILDPWELVNIPFDEEYPGDRQWNKNAAAFNCVPEVGETTHWMQVLNHVGRGLNKTVRDNVWCQENNVSNGADYLFAWIASMFKRPTYPLPYLFLFGEQKTGKSTLHEALSILFKKNRGYIRADQALKKGSEFNSQLANAVLCVVEETSLAGDKVAAARIKDWTTALVLSINTKFKNVYEIKNCTHWIQVSNDARDCAIFPGDTRIVAWQVFAFASEIPKGVLMERLEAEAPAFLHEILSYDLPDSPDRLGVPCLETHEKNEIARDNYNPLDQFIEEYCKICFGHCVPAKEFHSSFFLWLNSNYPQQLGQWSYRKMLRNFPRRKPLELGPLGEGNNFTLGNISLDQEAVDREVAFYRNDEGRLSQCSVNDYKTGDLA